MHQQQESEDSDVDMQNSPNEFNQHDVAGPSGAGAIVAGTDAGAAADTDASSSSAARGQQQTAAILKLDIDCCEEAFDYLPVKDLINVGNTCKRLKQVIGFILHQYYPSLHVLCRKDGVSMYDYLSYESPYYNMNHLVEHIQTIQVSGDIGNFGNIRSKFHRLRRINFYRDLTEPNIECLQLALQKVEILHFYDFNFNGNFYEKLLSITPKIKTLLITQQYEDTPAGIENGNEWMHRRYPTLEQFEWEKNVTSEVQTLLELNPNIRKLSVSDRYIRRQSDSLMTSNIKLDELKLEMEWIDKEIVNQMNALYGRGFYQKLKVRILNEFNDEGIQQLAELIGPVSLAFNPKGHTSGNIQLSKMIGLKGFSFIGSDEVVNLPTLPINLPNLERFSFYFASTDDILPFIRQSMNLKEIYVHELSYGTYFNSVDDGINLVKLNEERARLQGAEKTTVYVHEVIYLATKWALKETDYTYVRLKRLEAHAPW